MIKALCIGQASYDINIVTDGFPKEGTKERYESKIGSSSGSAANCAYLLAKWGMSSTFAGVIGNDSYGNRIKKDLESVNVDTRYIETSFEKDTILNFIIVNKESGNNTNFTVADEFTKLKKYDFDFAPDIIITDGFDPYATKVTLQKFPKANSVLMAKRISTEVYDLAKISKNVICSLEFAEVVSGIKADFNVTDTLAKIYFKVKSKLNKDVLITLKDKGILYCIDNQIKISPALKVDVKDQTCAGDVFAAAYAYIVANGGDIEKAIKYGNIAAGFKIQEIGIKNGIPSLENVDKYYVQNYE